MSSEKRRNKKLRSSRRRLRRKMKNMQFSFAIMMGIIAGALFGLAVENIANGIMFGIISAGVTSGLLSLNWKKFNVGAGRANDKIKEYLLSQNLTIQVKNEKIAMQLTFGFVQVMLKMFLATVTVPLYALYFLLRPLYYVPKQFLSSEDTRKLVYYQSAMVMLLSCTYYFWYLFCTEHGWADVAFSTGWSGVGVIIFGLVTLIISAMVVFNLALAFWVLYIINVINPAKAEGQLHNCYNDYNDSTYSWLSYGINDGKKPLQSVIYMLSIRIANVFIPPIIIAFYLFWLVAFMASKKTGLAILTSSVLTALHLFTCYSWSVMDAGNMAFWLSLGSALVIGAWIGIKINKMNLIFTPELPRLKLLKHAPVGLSLF